MSASNPFDAAKCLLDRGAYEQVREAPISASAVSLLRRAAELGSVDAQRVLGIQLCLGEGFIPQDEVEGRYWYTRAAERGDLRSQIETGLMHLLGEGGPQDARIGLRWLERAAAGSDAEGTARRAVETLIDVYETGRHGVPIDSTRAAEMKERLADLDAKSRGAEGGAG